MKVGFLIIASEVLDGKISDTNTKTLAHFLRGYHLEIQRGMIARDDKKSIKDALDSLFSECNLVVTSGGLGPTKDDITKETIAEYFGRRVSYSKDAQEIAEAHYKAFGRPFPGREHGYCFLPEDFSALPNSTGFAPGLFASINQKIIFSAPGVPREFSSMLNDHLEKIVIKNRDHSEILDNVIIRTKRIPEEKIFGEVDPTLWEKLEQLGEVCSLPTLMGVDIGVKIRAKSQDEMSKKVRTVHDIINASPIRPNVWHFGPETLEEKIVVLANQKKIRFGFAESATGGLCSHRITNISGSSQCFTGSVICYDEKIKEHILGVSGQTLKEHSAVSIECAEEMAKGLREKFSLDIAISITGFAGPGGGNDKFPVGSVCIGNSQKTSKTLAQSYHFKGSREVLKERFAQAALHILLEEVEKFS